MRETCSIVLLTSLASDDHGLHDETEQLVQDQVEEDYKRPQLGGGQGDNAEL